MRNVPLELTWRVTVTAMDHQTPAEFLDSVEGEISFFRSIMRARPVGIHKHFHLLAIRNSIHNDTGRIIPIENIWAKLRTCYDLEALEGAETDGFDTTTTPASYPLTVRSPSPSENLSRHPFFRDEFSLPTDETFESLVATRRVRATASIPSSTPAPSPRQPSKSRKSRAPKRKNKADMAGLVGGDSDSSALTQESGDEASVPTPRDSVITGTDAGTDYEDDPEIQEMSASTQFKASRGRVSKSGRGGTAGRARAGSTSFRGGVKKRKK